jgi:hypothetical protein
MEGALEPVATANVAVTETLALAVMTHAPVPEQAPPDHPEKTFPDAGVAVSVTTVPAATVVVQLVPQSMAVGDEVTVPEPLVLTMKLGWSVAPATVEDCALVATASCALAELMVAPCAET